MGLRSRLAPTTPWGRASGWLALAFVGWFVVNQTLMGLGTQQPDALPRAFLIAQGLVGLATGALTGVVAIVAIVRFRERSPLVFVATLPLLLVLFLVAGELLVPH